MNYAKNILPCLGYQRTTALWASTVVKKLSGRGGAWVGWGCGCGYPNPSVAPIVHLCYVKSVMDFEKHTLDSGFQASFGDPVTQSLGKKPFWRHLE